MPTFIVVGPVVLSGELVAVEEQDLPADHRDLYADVEIGLGEVDRLVGGRLRRRRVRLRLQVVDQNRVSLTT